MEQGLLTADTQQLRRCINDLVSVLALPAMWVGCEPSKIVESLLDSVLEMLHLDLVYLHIRDPIGDAPAESHRTAESLGVSIRMAEIRAALKRWLGADPQDWPPRVEIGEGELSIVPLCLGLHGEIGLLIAGSRRVGFPLQTERLLLGMAANQATIGLQGVRHLIDQKRIADELDRRVAQRTAELSAMNEELRRQVLERQRAEENLRVGELLLGSMIDSLPVPLGIMTASGECEAVNHPMLDYSGKTQEELKLWTTSDVVHAEDRPAAVAAWHRALENGQPYQIETRLRRADGVYRWHNVHRFPMRSADGRILRWLVLQLDVHDRRDAEVLLRSLVDSIAAPVTLCAPTGEMEAVNRFAEDYHRKSADEIMNWTSGDMIFAADLPRAQAAWRRSIETGEPYNVEVRARRADGVYRWMHSHGFPVRDADGRIVRWCVLHLDIHDRKQAEEVLAASERNLNLTINSIPAMAWSADIDGNVEFVNQNYLDYVGRPLDQMRNAGWKDVVHPDDVERSTETWKTIMGSRRAGEAEARLRRFDGSYRWFLMRVSPLYDEAANVIKWHGVNTDIEDLKRAEEALRASELNLRRQTETIPLMLWSAAPDGTVDYCNGRLLEYAGLSAEAVMRDDWKKIRGDWQNTIHPDDRESTARAWETSVATGEPHRIEVREFHAADSTYRWCLVTALPLRDDHGRILKWHGAVVDMHDWKQAQDDLRNTQAELAHMTRVMTMGHLTASIAHELNQPLAGIITNASTCLRMLAADPPNVVGARETARRTVRDGNRAAEVITRLRALFSKRHTAIEAVDLNTATQEVIALTLTELQRASVSLRVELADDLPFVKGDRVQLQQVIMNLILNAVEAMDGVTGRPKDLVVATGSVGGDHVQVVVQDAGMGFDSATAEKLFNPFHTTKSHGMGIGLSVSRSIVENHQGRLWARTNEGPGATFLFSIPANAGRDGAGNP